jgi:hypothetical protein
MYSSVISNLFLLLLLFFTPSFLFILLFLPQRESPLQMQYFPSEGRFDKMYFPYYGKNLHVSTLRYIFILRRKLFMNRII